MALGREAVGWSQELWDRLDRVVHEEVRRTSVASTFLPLVAMPGAVTVPSDTIERDRLAIPEDGARPLVELFAEFVLTPAQVESEQPLLTAGTLATRSANLLAQAEDALIFQGDSAPVFKLVNRRQSAGQGLVATAEDEIVVRPLEANTGRFGERTFGAVAQAYTRLQSRGHYGPYALALRDQIFADTLAPLPGTLVSPADRIKPLVSASFVGVGTLPQSTGVILSLGGNTIDLVIGNDASTAFTRVDEDGLFHFRVAERFVLRIKDSTAIVRLRFADK